MITDEVIQDRFDHVTLARLALEGGAEVIQYREKRSISDRARLVVAEAIAQLCADHGATLIVDDRADIAAIVGAGVHLGPADLPAARARTLVGGPVGVTVNTLEMARGSDVAFAHYLGCGPVFGTRSKGPKPPANLGVDGLRAIAQEVAVPIIAIGGVDLGHIGDLIDAGAHGVAVIGAVALSEDPARAAADLLRAILESACA